MNSIFRGGENLEYKIARIQHSGTCGERWTDRTDDRYIYRVGRTVNIDIDDFDVGFPMILHYLKDQDGSDYSDYILATSRVKRVSIPDENTVIIETRNSIFRFEKCK